MIFEKDELQKALKFVLEFSGIAPPFYNKEVAIRRVEGDVVQVYIAFDFMGASCLVEAKEIEPWFDSVVISGDILSEIIAQTKEIYIRITPKISENDVLRISSDGFYADVTERSLGMDTDILYKKETSQQITLVNDQVRTFCNALECAAKMADDKQAGSVLSCVLIEEIDTGLCVVGTDGHLLSSRTVSHSGCEGFGRVALLGKLAGLIGKLCEGQEQLSVSVASISLSTDYNIFNFTFGNCSVSFRQKSGKGFQYPEHRKLLSIIRDPDRFETNATEIFKRLKPFVSHSKDYVELIVCGDSVTLRSANYSSASFESVVCGDTGAGGLLRFYANPDYLAVVLKMFHGPVTIDVSSCRQWLKVAPEGAGPDDFVVLAGIKVQKDEED